MSYRRFCSVMKYLLDEWHTYSADCVFLVHLRASQGALRVPLITTLQERAPWAVELWIGDGPYPGNPASWSPIAGGETWFKKL